MDDVKSEVEKLKQLLKRDLKKGNPMVLPNNVLLRTAKELAHRRKLIRQGIKPAAGNVKVMDVDTLNELLDKARAFDKTKRTAGRKIIRYTEVMNTDAELDAIFGQWLGVYSILALFADDALEVYWVKFDQPHPCVPMTAEEIDTRKDHFYFVTGEDGRSHVIFRDRKARKRNDNKGKTGERIDSASHTPAPVAGDA